MLANIIGCGVKGNPVILSKMQDDGIVVQNLRAVALDSAIILQWNFYGKDSRINYIAIEKSELGSVGNKCKDCPRKFERIGQLKIKEINQESKEYISFSDKKITHDKIYNYRLLLCDEFNNCFENALIEIDYK